MGWDAFSSVRRNYNSHKLHDFLEDEVFKKASEFVKDKAGEADGLLRFGGLDVGECGDMLTEATGASVYDSNGWSQEYVQELAQLANWDFEYDKEDEVHYWSARKFLEACAELNLSMKFSW